VALGSGWEGYGFLLLFYLLANGSTYVGASRKERLDIAEPDGGRRATGSVFSKGLYPALFALVSPVALTASLAVYAADTVASEIGKLSRARPWVLCGRRRCDAGTPGAVSLSGSLAGVAVAALFSLLLWAAAWLQRGLGGARLTRFHVLFLKDDLRRLGATATGASQWPHLLPWIALAVFVSVVTCFFLESALNETAVRRRWLPKEVVHLAIGALAGALPFVLFFVLSGGLWPPSLWMTR
jgi:uncharacterized membrane protein